MKRITERMILLSLAELSKLEKVADVCENEYAKNPESAKAENDFDAAYSAQYEKMIECVDYIVSYSNGAIDAKTARRMIVGDLRTQLIGMLSATVG